MIATSTLPAEPAHSSRLRIGLIALSGVILFGALSDVPALFLVHDQTGGLLVFAQRLLGLKLALAPVIAGAALVLAIRHRPTYATVALATLMLVDWIAELPTIAIHGMELTGGGFLSLVVAMQRILYPLLAVAAIALALRNDRLVTAAALTAVPLLVNTLGVAAFAIGVAIYGF
jgi:hypothetical protein